MKLEILIVAASLWRSVVRADGVNEASGGGSSTATRRVKLALRVRADDIMRDSVKLLARLTLRDRDDSDTVSRRSLVKGIDSTEARMVIRRYWMGGVVVLLTATVGIVALDLRDAAPGATVER